MSKLRKWTLGGTAVMVMAWGMASVSGQSVPAAPGPRIVEVLAKRFAFEPATIDVTEGERVRLLVKSADGVHGLQIKKARVNTLIPRGGQPVAIDFVAPAPGSYPILCSEECGEGHEQMTGTLVVTAKAPPGAR